MRESARGAVENGGMVVSILPDGEHRFREPLQDRQHRHGNRIRQELDERAVLRHCGGGGRADSGTLSEIAYAWAYNKPIVALTCADGWGKKLAGESLDNRRSDSVNQRGIHRRTGKDSQGPGVPGLIFGTMEVVMTRFALTALLCLSAPALFATIHENLIKRRPDWKLADVKILVSQGADIYTKDREGRTPASHRMQQGLFQHSGIPGQ